MILQASESMSSSHTPHHFSPKSKVIKPVNHNRRLDRQLSTKIISISFPWTAMHASSCSHTETALALVTKFWPIPSHHPAFYRTTSPAFSLIRTMVPSPSVPPSSGWCAGSHQTRRAMAAMFFRIVNLASKVSQSGNNIPDQRSHGRLFLDAHRSNSQGLVQSPRRIPALQCWVRHLGKLPPVFKQGPSLKIVHQQTLQHSWVTNTEASPFQGKQDL